MATIQELILRQKARRYPTGRAFRMHDGGYRYGLHRALSISEAKAYEDSIAILDSMLPDNAMFTVDDATDWERRLGIITNLATPLVDRMAAIRRKMSAPGVQPAHGHYLYIQRQLQAAGFDVYVYENIFPDYPDGYITMNPAAINPAIFSEIQQGDFQQGDQEQGYYINNIIANSLYVSEDILFNIGSSLKATFFIGGPTLGTYASVLETRELEFRQLILNLKQVQTVGILYINYI